MEKACVGRVHLENALAWEPPQRAGLHCAGASLWAARDAPEGGPGSEEGPEARIQHGMCSKGIKRKEQCEHMLNHY